MAEDFELEAEIGIDVTNAVRDARRLATTLADLNDATGNVDSNIERLERSSAGAAATLSRFTKQGRAAGTTAQQQAKAINALVNQYRALEAASGKGVASAVVGGANPANIAVRQVQKQIDDERAFSGLLAQEYRNREQRAADAAKSGAQERERISKDTRQRELSALRNAMQERARLEQEAEKRSADAARAGSVDRERIAQQSRQRELADLRRAMQERAAVQAQIDKAYTGAQVENATRGLQGASFTGAFRADAFAGLRDSAEYSDMLNESLRGLANQRYALYDVATSIGVVATAAAAAGTAAVVMGGQFDKAFGQVERTTMLSGDAAANLREELIGITTAIPTNFDEVTGIATLGAQMNIADEALTGFTETVAKFSAATDVSVDSAATGFGRLAQLTQTPQNEIENLASSIYQTGINAVATESEILSVSQQIATAGNQAGFTVTEIVALGSALSSLGVAPEQSRGAIMRIFGDITSAAGEGGEALDKFADTAGMTGEAFGQMWANDPQQAFSAYLEGLSQLDKQLVDVTLKQQGFVNVRDRNVLSRLANNTEVYNAALTDTSEAYSENTALAEGAAIAQDNLIDRLTRLANAAKALLASAGQNDFLNSLVEGLIAATDAIRQFTETPVGKFVAGTVLALTGLVAIVGSIGVAVAMGRASLMALVIAMRSNMAASAGSTLSLRALTAELLRMDPAVTKVTASLGAMTSAQGRAAVGARVMGAALRGALISTGIGAALVALPALINGVANSFKSASTKAEEYFEAMPNGGTGLAEALQADTAAWQETGNAISTVKTQVPETSESLNGLASSLQTATGGQVQLTDGTTKTTTALRDQVVAIGENTRAWLANTLANDENLQKLWENQEALSVMKFNMQDFINATLKNPGTGGQNYLQQLKDDLNATHDATWRTSDQYRDLLGVFPQLTNLAQNYDTKVRDQSQSAKFMSEVMSAAGVEITEVGEASSDASGEVEDLGNAMSDLAEGAFGGVAGVAEVEGALYSLGESLYENGNSFSAYSEAGRANLQALQGAVSAMAAQAGDDSVMFANNIGGLMAHLQDMGISTGAELSYLGNMLNQLVGNEWGLDFNSAPARADIQAFIQDAINALKVRAQLERAAYDLKATFQEAEGDAIGGALTRAQGLGVSAGFLAQANQMEQFRKTVVDTGKKGFNAGRSISDGFKAAGREAQNAGNAAGGAGKKAADAGKSGAQGAKEMQKEFRTLKDYANDLASVFDRQLEFAFGTQNAKDDTANLWADMREGQADLRKSIRDMRKQIAELGVSFTDAKLKVREFKAELRGLRADKNTLQYQLRVAIEYGDDLRAAEIRAELAEKNSEIANTTNDVKKAEKDATKAHKDANGVRKEVNQAQKELNAGLKGGSQAARDNRSKINALVESYKDQLVQLAANGASQKTLKERAKQLNVEFTAQARKLGLSREETKKYKDQMSAFTRVINKVPRNVNVKVKAGTSAASKAITEFIKTQRKRTITMNARVNTPKSVRGGTYRPSAISGSSGARGGTYRPSSIKSQGSLSAPSVRTTTFYAGDTRTTQTKGKGNRTGGLPFSTGGSVPQYLATGGVSGLHPGQPKGTDTTPAWLTPGEYVQRKAAVDHYGVDFMNAVNSMRFPQYLAQGSGNGGLVQASASGPAVQLVELMPNQVQQIVRAVSTTIQVDGQKLASTVNGSNRNNSTRGSN